MLDSAAIETYCLFAVSLSRSGFTTCPKRASRLDYLSAHATEVNTRLILPNDFLFKVDIASMKEGLEIRVPS